MERPPERREPPRREREIRFEQALEFQERFVVEGDEVDIGGAHAGDVEARANGVVGKIRIVLHAREALFLGGGFDAAIDDECRRRIVVVRG